MQSVFADIYKNKVWFNGSGSGSQPGNTAAYRMFLQAYLKDHGIKSVLDIGCGDWLSTKLINWDGIDYLGIDTVQSVVDEDNQRFANDHIRFECGDVTEMDELPVADLVIIKDVFQHWPNHVISQFVAQLGQFPHQLIINTVQVLNMADGADITQGTNADIETGRFRPINLALPPFGFGTREVFKFSTYSATKPVEEIKSVVTLANM